MLVVIQKINILLITKKILVLNKTPPMIDVSQRFISAKLRVTKLKVTLKLPL